MFFIWWYHFYYYICLVQQYNTTQDMKITSQIRTKNFRKFMGDCYVDHVMGNEYDVVSSGDEETFIRVRSLGNHAYRITENDFFNINSDAKREMVFLRMDQYFKEQEREDNSDYEHPSIAGDIYSQAI